MYEGEMHSYKYSEEFSFRQLYFSYIDKKLKDDDSNVDQLNHPIEMLKSAFEKPRRALSLFDLNVKHNAYAYLNRLGPVSSGLVRQKILEALTKYQELRFKITHPVLKIVNLGSGPGTDVVGFCSALWEKFQKQTAAPQCERLDFTLVDYIENWKDMAEELEQMIREGHYGFVSRMFKTKEINMEFLLMNLDSHPVKNADFSSKMKEADIILVVRILTHLKEPLYFLEMIHAYTNDNVTVVFIEPESSMDPILQGQNMFQIVNELQTDVPESKFSEIFCLEPCDPYEPFPEYRINMPVIPKSNNRLYVLEKRR